MMLRASYESKTGDGYVFHHPHDGKPLCGKPGSYRLADPRVYVSRQWCSVCRSLEHTMNQDDEEQEGGGCVEAGAFHSRNIQQTGAAHVGGKPVTGWSRGVREERARRAVRNNGAPSMRIEGDGAKRGLFDGLLGEGD